MTTPGARDFYGRARSRLSRDELERELDRMNIPYNLSLHALAPYFLETGARQGWLHAGDKPLIMAVSGGGDSVAMLWLFRVFHEGRIVAAHVNHGIRGRDSDGDADFVRELAMRWELPFVERRVSIPSERRRGESLEAAARRVRHRELINIADGSGAWGIATGHNRDDLAETVLFNLLRGAGVRGSVGIPERRDPFFRPVLGLRREFLRRLLSVRGIPWREDATNGDVDYTRNFIRLELLPIIENRVNSGAVEHLASFAEDMRERREDEDCRGKSLLMSAIADEDGDAFTLSREAVASLSSAERALVIREAGRRAGLPTLPRARTRELDRLILSRAPFTFQWARRADVRGERGAIRWRKLNF